MYIFLTHPLVWFKVRSVADALPNIWGAKLLLLLKAVFISIFETKDLCSSKHWAASAPPRPPRCPPMSKVFEDVIICLVSIKTKDY